jgi:hypothetical protein
MYYLTIGAGMMVTGWAQSLAATLIACGVIAVTLCLIQSPAGRESRRLTRTG